MNEHKSLTTTHENVESSTERAHRNPYMDVGSAPGSESELTIECIRERADTNSELLERIMRRSVPPQKWGIIE